eukprot:CAMPEP_0176501608 /NCGR_PEP_ID=MMETSP0200_2-20121128/14252_1 /TAXON_ID=947934 /ORGANISM="Chaetoceros sp., Strain GSL56" /LENGTH=352 /DNA_ID=CAMNT_0017900507 /DNA_START=123 /DNA_END=1178 /DNA_ORIENTATION=-
MEEFFYVENDLLPPALLRRLSSSSPGGRRQLQGLLPDYTSPPTELALEATPEAYRSDEIIDQNRDMAAASNCTATTATERCHIPFPATAMYDSKIGVVLYGGGLIDPRGYSVIAERLASRYGFHTVIPIFANDLAFSFGVCDSMRLDMAKAEFPQVEKWVLAGHSFGGVSAIVDSWSRYNSGDVALGGVALMAADIQQTLDCGAIDFSNSTLPMASITGALDGVLNMTRFSSNQQFLSPDTQFVDVFGGNHGDFGSYDYSERRTILGQNDGTSLISPEIQWDLSVAAIANVATRMGVEMPKKIIPAMEECDCPTLGNGTDGGSADTSAAAFRVNVGPSTMNPIFMTVLMLAW